MADLANIFGRHEFVIRRLHSLTGLVPIGAFLFIHLVTNASILDGPETYQLRVDQIHTLGPVTLDLIEWTFIFVPIFFHGLIGLVIVTRGERNVLYYPYRENLRYTLQRYTGVISFAFILWHVFHTRGWFRWPWWIEHVTRPLGGGTFDPLDAAASTAAAIQASAVIQVVYAVGVLASVYHLANGLWTMGITWGVWTTRRSQGWANYVALAAGVVLLVLGAGALIGMATVVLVQ